VVCVARAAVLTSDFVSLFAAGFASSSTGKALAMRVMAVTWTLILVGGIVYFTIIGLSHH
jgi:hypothetical protein